MMFTKFIQDVLRGTKIVETTKFLISTDLWTKEQIEEYQLAKLKKMIEFCSVHVPYYRDLFKSINLKPEDINTLKDIEKIPILTKETVREEFNNLVADNIDINSYKIKTAKTGGTTGVPLKFYKNTQTRDFTWGAYYRWHNWMGIKPNSRRVVIWGDASIIAKSKVRKLTMELVDRANNTLTFNAFELGNATIKEVANKIIMYKPALLHGYLSSIFQLARYFKENNLTLPSLKAISSTTETLLPIYREFIESTFNVKMFDQYGSGECCSIAFECPEHKGLHVNEEHCIIETINDDDEICIDVSAKVLTTDLDNYATPFIRYKNGDSVIISSERCTCGRHSKLLHQISGRTKDVIYLKDGSEVNGVFFANLFYDMGYDDFKYFTRFQIRQTVKGSFNCTLEKTDIPIPEKELLRIEEVLNRYSDGIVIEFVDKLKNDKSGKFRYIISDL